MKVSFSESMVVGQAFKIPLLLNRDVSLKTRERELELEQSRVENKLPRGKNRNLYFQCEVISIQSSG